MMLNDAIMLRDVIMTILSIITVLACFISMCLPNDKSNLKKDRMAPIKPMDDDVTIEIF